MGCFQAAAQGQGLRVSTGTSGSDMVQAARLAGVPASLSCSELTCWTWCASVRVADALRVCGMALALLPLHPWAGIPVSLLSHAAFEPAGWVVAAAAMSAGAASRLEMSFVKA